MVNGAFSPVIEVFGIAAGQTVTLRGLTVGPSSFGMKPISIHDNAGHVHCEQLTSPFPAVIERSAQVSLHLVSLEGAPPLRVRDSTLAIAQCGFDAFPVVFTRNYGAVFERSPVSIAACIVRGGSDSFAFTGPGPAIDLLGGTLRLGGADTSILAGLGGGSLPAPAITATGGTIHVDPVVRLGPANGAPPITGTANVVTGPVPSTRAVVSGTQLTATVHAEPGYRSVLLGGVTLGPRLDTPFGQLWLGFPHILLDAGSVPANGQRSVTINLPPQSLGVLATLQAVLLDPSNNLQLSTPTVLTID